MLGLGELSTLAGLSRFIGLVIYAIDRYDQLKHVVKGVPSIRTSPSHLATVLRKSEQTFKNNLDMVRADKALCCS